MAGKLKFAREVVQSIPSGSHIGLGGFSIARNPIVLVHELIRQQKKDLTISQGVAGLDTDLLVGAGLVKRLIIALHPGVQLQNLVANTGFPLQISKEVPSTPLPTDEELRLLREEIDPKGAHLN